MHCYAYHTIQETPLYLLEVQPKLLGISILIETISVFPNGLALFLLSPLFFFLLL